MPFQSGKSTLLAAGCGLLAMCLLTASSRPAIAQTRQHSTDGYIQAPLVTDAGRKDRDRRHAPERPAPPENRAKREPANAGGERSRAHPHATQQVYGPQQVPGENKQALRHNGNAWKISKSGRGRKPETLEPGQPSATAPSTAAAGGSPATSATDKAPAAALAPAPVPVPQPKPNPVTTTKIKGSGDPKVSALAAELAAQKKGNQYALKGMSGPNPMPSMALAAKKRATSNVKSPRIFRRANGGGSARNSAIAMSPVQRSKGLQSLQGVEKKTTVQKGTFKPNKPTYQADQ